MHRLPYGITQCYLLLNTVVILAVDRNDEWDLFADVAVNVTDRSVSATEVATNDASQNIDPLTPGKIANVDSVLLLVMLTIYCKTIDHSSVQAALPISPETLYLFEWLPGGRYQNCSVLCVHVHSHKDTQMSSSYRCPRAFCFRFSLGLFCYFCLFFLIRTSVFNFRYFCILPSLRWVSLSVPARLIACKDSSQKCVEWNAKLCRKSIDSGIEQLST